MIYKPHGGNFDVGFGGVGSLFKPDYSQNSKNKKLSV